MQAEDTTPAAAAGPEGTGPAEASGLDRRNFLKRTVTTAGVIALPAAVAWPVSRLAGPSPVTAVQAAASTAPAGGFVPFVDSYTTNTMANLTAETNAAVRALSGMQHVWRTGTAWNNGTPLMPEVLRDNIRYCARTTRRRTDAQAREAFIFDRQHQSHAVIAGLGPLAGIYKKGAKAVTGITSAPDGTPATKINDAVPAGAPAGSALGAGAVDSELGRVAQLVNTVRGPYASGNPSKYAYQYPRPWRLTRDSRVIDTGATDALGHPVYESDVIVAPQLLRQRSADPAEDGGYPSGHSNAFYLAALAMAYAVPERFQELVARASDLAHTRIVSGMHSPVDVIGGRILATALTAAALNDPQNAELKAAARSQAAAYFQAQTGTTADTLYAYAHSAPLGDDPYADRDRSHRSVAPRLTYILPRRGHQVPMTVPKGAEVLLETRLPYLDAGQRREVLRTTALPSGYVLLDGPEQWGRLDLFTAADGYGAFDTEVTVTMNAAQSGFHAADAWRNDIGGTGRLVKRGTGTLTLTGANRYRGGTRVEAGVLVAGSPAALGRGDVEVRGGTLSLDPAVAAVQVRGAYVQSRGGVLRVAAPRRGRHAARAAALTAGLSATLAPGSVLEIQVDAEHPPAAGTTMQVIRSRRLKGRFGTITVRGASLRAVPVYTATGLHVRLVR